MAEDNKPISLRTPSKEGGTPPPTQFRTILTVPAEGFVLGKKYTHHIEGITYHNATWMESEIDGQKMALFDLSGCVKTW